MRTSHGLELTSKIRWKQKILVTEHKSTHGVLLLYNAEMQIRECMKLRQIKTIKGYKSFKDFSWQPFLNNENFHEDLNIFYGENGSGKSSICNILKNVLPGGSIAEIVTDDKHGYKTFGKNKPKQVSLQFDTVEYNFKYVSPETVGFNVSDDHIVKGTPFTAHTLEIKSVNIKQYGKERISNFKRNQRSNTGTY
jgi:AAA15 family ATPase/GTPase